MGPLGELRKFALKLDGRGDEPEIGQERPADKSRACDRLSPPEVPIASHS